ncbi:response regulator [Nocardioides sp.]|uniref:response regulator n=1 Tax=Nocardioides sp. TaxID=35761 RepID=UPI002633EFF9|nr:response regulator [Nocardioides sp.]
MVSERKLAVIIEDDPDVRNLLRTVLTQSGFETVLTSNGEDGVAAVRMHEPVLTTLDVSMPGMDGMAAAAAIREFSDTYIIMITAQDEEIDIISGLNAGADEYLSKPFRPRELRARIASLLRRPRGAHPAEAEGQADDGLWHRPTDSAERATEQPAPALVQQPAFTRTPLPQQVHVEQQPAPVTPYVPEQRPLEAPVPQSFQQPVYERPAPPQRPAYEQQTYEQPTQVRAGVAFDAQAPAVSPAAGQSFATTEGVYAYNGLELTVSTGQVVAAGRAVDLDRDEFDLLRTLMSTGRRVRSKADLVLAARGESYVTSYFVTEQDKRHIDRQISSLRRKLNDDLEPGRWIETVAGVGYRMAA